MPFWASACIVRVDPKVQEFATLMTEIRITALKIDGSAGIPASTMAITKGEPRDSEVGSAYRGLFAGTINPMRKRLTI